MSSNPFPMDYDNWLTEPDRDWIEPDDDEPDDFNERRWRDEE